MTGRNFRDLRERLLALLGLNEEDRNAELTYLDQTDPDLARELRSLLDHHTDVAPILEGDLLPSGQTLARDFGQLNLDNHVPETLGPYQIEEIIGEGGMGVVYRALQKSPVEREVAIKHVRLGMDTARIVTRFKSESQVLARMNHPSIATVFDAGIDERGRPYFVMELVDGRPINRWSTHTRASRDQIVDLFLVLCDAMQHAHQKGIIHRDLKPGNLLVRNEGGLPQLKIIDFGIAKALNEDGEDLTRPGLMMGTPSYMSPEQFGAFGGEADTRTDVYALGVVLYELLTGRVPVVPNNPTTEQARIAVLEKDPLRPGDLPGDLSNILLMALRKDPERRYGSVDQLSQDIRRFRRGEPVAAHADSWTYRSRKFVQRHKFMVGLVATAFVILTGFAATISFQAENIRQERNRAIEAEQAARIEAETAQEITDFMVDLIAEGNPDQRPGESVTVREVVDLGAVRIRSELEDRPAIQWRLLEVLGGVYTGLGQVDQADSLLSETLEVQKIVFGAESTEIAATLEQLGTVAHGQGDYDLAVDRYQAALDMQRRIDGNESARVAYIQNTLAIALEARGDYRAARPHYQEALAMNRKLLGEEDPEVAWGLNTLGQSYWRLGDYAQAERLFGEAAALARRLFDGPHPDLMAALNNYAGILRLNGQLSESEDINRECVAGYQAIYPEGHPGVGRAHANLGRILLERGKVTEALDQYEEGAVHMARTAGEEHILYGKNLASLGWCRVRAGQPEQGVAEMLRARQIIEDTVGRRHPSFANAQRMMTEGFIATGHHAEAIASCEDALNIRLERRGTIHPMVADAREILALALLAAGDEEEATRQALLAAGVYDQSLSPEHYLAVKGKGRLKEAGLIE